MPDQSSQSKPLVGASGQSSQRDMSTVAADLAIQQENEGLRLALREQERIVEELTNECRRLEDRLEDRYQDIDALRRELDRGERALKQAEERPSPLVEGGGASPAARAPSTQVQAGEDRKEAGSESARSKGGALGFGQGLLTGTVLVAGAVAGLWFSGILILASEAPGSPKVAGPVTKEPAQPTLANGSPTSASTSAGSSASASPNPAIAAQDQQPKPAVDETSSDSDVRVAQGVASPSSMDTADEPERSGDPEVDKAAADAMPASAPSHPASEDLQVPAEPVAGSHVDAFVAEDVAAPELIVLKPSEFMMGNPVGMADSDARPVHKVRLEGFMIGAQEVTFADYDRYVRETGARRPQDYGWGRGARPVIDVSWDEALAYTNWLSKKTGKPYRLPTEAEWEYAARGGTTSSYWWGIGSVESRALCVNCGTRWDQISTAPVGSFPPNPFGLFDTAGNVYEWAADCYHYNYKGAASDGAARSAPGCKLRVARGGSFNSPAGAMRSHARNHFATDARVDMLGFRVARDLYPADDG